MKGCFSSLQMLGKRKRGCNDVFQSTEEKRAELGRHGWKEQGAAPSWIIDCGTAPSEESSRNVCNPVASTVKAQIPLQSVREENFQSRKSPDCGA